MSRAVTIASLVTLLTFSSWGQIAPAAEKDPPKHSAVTPVPRAGNWMKRHEKFNARVAEGNVEFLMIGDSITQGWEGAGREVWAKHYEKRNAVNLGIGGDRTQHVLWRLENGNIKGISPKLAVIMIGTNNARSNSAREIADGVKAIVKKLRTDLPKMEVLVLAIFPRGANDDDKNRKKNMAANKLIAKLAENEMVQTSVFICRRAALADGYRAAARPDQNHVRLGLRDHPVHRAFRRGPDPPVLPPYLCHRTPHRP